MHVGYRHIKEQAVTKRQAHTQAQTQLEEASADTVSGGQCRHS